MYKLYIEEDGVRTLIDTFNTDLEARQRIVDHCNETGFKSYYWNCYELPEEDELAGGTHIDFGSWSTFFIIVQEWK